MGIGAALSRMGAVYWDAAVEIVPLFLLAILLGALIEEFLPQRAVERFLTGRNPGTMLLASVLGAVIPLCTCGMVPLAVALRRRGGDLKHVFGFLTAGAAVSLPVVLLTAGVLDARWATVRLVASVAFGLVVGYASVVALRGAAARSALPAGPAPADGAPPGAGLAVPLTPARMPRARSILRRFAGQTREYAPWVLVSLALAAVVDVLVPRHFVHVLYGQRTTLGALIASLTGLPFYFCSGAELPLVRELLSKGMGAGPAAAMILAVPIVNLPTLGIVSKWLGPGAAVRYLALCAGAATILGVVTGILLT